MDLEGGMEDFVDLEGTVDLEAMGDFADLEGMEDSSPDCSSAVPLAGACGLIITLLTIIIIRLHQITIIRLLRILLSASADLWLSGSGRRESGATGGKPRIW